MKIFRLVRSRRAWALIPVMTLVLWFLFGHQRSDPFVIVSSDPKFEISARCTFGTNHIYYYGDLVDRMFDPAIKLLSRDGNQYPYRLRHETTNPGTMVWVRCDHPDDGRWPTTVMATPMGPVRTPVGRPSRFLGHWTDESGIKTLLEQKNFLHHYKGGYFVGSWLLPGSLESHRGSVLRIESTNGAEIVTLRGR